MSRKSKLFAVLLLALLALYLFSLMFTSSSNGLTNGEFSHPVPFETYYPGRATLKGKSGFWLHVYFYENGNASEGQISKDIRSGIEQHLLKSNIEIAPPDQGGDNRIFIFEIRTSPIQDSAGNKLGALVVIDLQCRDSVIIIRNQSYGSAILWSSCSAIAVDKSRSISEAVVSQVNEDLAAFIEMYEEQSE